MDHTVNLFPHASSPSWTASIWSVPAHTGFWLHVSKNAPSHAVVRYSLEVVDTQHSWSTTCSPRRRRRGGGGGDRAAAAPASATKRAGAIDAEPLRREEEEEDGDDVMVGMVPDAVVDAAIVQVVLMMTAITGRAELAFMAVFGVRCCAGFL